MKRFFRSFGYALQGFGPAWRGQTNIKVMLGIGVVAVGLGAVLEITRIEWALIASMIGLVLGLELVNTAGEKLIDLVCPQEDDRYGQMKDILAAAVLVASIAAATVGMLIFAPRLFGS